MSQQQTVTSIIELLVTGKFICNQSYRDLYLEMDNESIQSQVRQALELMGRKLMRTERSQTYYAAYSEVNSANRENIRQNQMLMHEMIRPIVGFMTIINTFDSSDRAVQRGDEYRPSLIEEASHTNSDLTKTIEALSRHPKLKKSKKNISIRERINAITEFMLKNQIIATFNKDKGIYVVTGKIDYIYSVLEFIDQHELIVEKAKAHAIEQQGSLFDD